jgi:ketoreductase
MFINKVAIITGASRGIGLAIAKKLRNDGASVALCARSIDLLKRHQSEMGDQSLAVAMDIRDQRNVEEGIRRIVDRFGKIDIVVNNAGVSGVTPIDEKDGSAWINIINTNIAGSYFVTQKSVRHMPDGGRIIMISSVLGKFGVPGYTAYCTAKTGLIGFTRALALELSPRKITVNALCPGWVETDMALTGMKNGAASEGISVEEFRKLAMSRVPLGEMVTPEEVAALVAFLASDAGKNITAQAISICGGSTQA